MVVRMNMMDAANSALEAAAALADSIKRNEQFDARGHRPGFVLDRASDADTAREQRDARLRDSWKTPPAAITEDVALMPVEKAAIVDPTGTNNAELRKAADAVIANRDRRISEAWRSNA